MADTFRIRVYYEVKGRLSLLSHLELARALERLVRRASLPYAISQGFSPHMKIAFGSALPVGIGGMQECFDVQLTQYCEPDKVFKSLFDECMNELIVTRVDYIDKSYPAASVAFPVSTYRVEFSESLMFDLTIPERIFVKKKGKEREIIVSEHLVEGPLVEGNDVEFSLLAKPTGSLRADQFLEAMLSEEETAKAVSFMRIEQRSA